MINICKCTGQIWTFINYSNFLISCMSRMAMTLGLQHFSLLFSGVLSMKQTDFSVEMKNFAISLDSS